VFERLKKAVCKTATQAVNIGGSNPPLLTKKGQMRDIILGLVITGVLVGQAVLSLAYLYFVYELELFILFMRAFSAW
jgi:hypothetical protein